ncbi:ATP-binding protein [Streptococcus sp. 27098_8_76]|uniref:ATP-binding protein n=1 Tax=Streptococcus sp. 27098_8_76 TaxID=3003658 RepID=UPI0021B64150
MRYKKLNPITRLNYTDEIDSVYCIVGKNGSGKTTLVNSLLSRNKQIINDLFEDIDDIFNYSFVKFSSAIELVQLGLLPENSFDISTSAFLDTMNLINLHREDSIKQVEVINSYYNKNEENTKWEDLIELSGKTVSLRLNQIGDGIISYGKTYLKGTGFLKEFEDKITEIPTHGYKNKVLKVLMRKFFAIFATEIVPLFEYFKKDNQNRTNENNRQALISLLENIDFRTIQPRGKFYEDLEKFLKNHNIDQDMEGKITQLTNFFEDISKIVSNIGRELDFTVETDRETLNVILKSLKNEGSDNSISREVFSVLEFEWSGLSSGELALINLFGRLNSIKNEVRKNMVLLLDEVDLGLHPEWQRKWVKNILPIIGKIMKSQNGSVRVVVTTHSPIILSDFMKKDIIYLPIDDSTEKSRTFGQNIYTLFKDSFFLEAPKGAFSEQVIEDLLNIFRSSSNEKTIQESGAYKGFIKKYGLSGVPDDTIREFFDELVDMIGEDIIRNHLKKQIKKARWINESNDSLDYEKEIDELKKQIEELKKKKNKNDKDNQFL